MENISLLEYVLAELEKRKGTWPTLARKAGVEYSWMTKLAQGKIPDPSVNKIQVLADFCRLNPVADEEKATS